MKRLPLKFVTKIAGSLFKYPCTYLLFFPCIRALPKIYVITKI